MPFALDVLSRLVYPKPFSKLNPVAFGFRGISFQTNFPNLIKHLVIIMLIGNNCNFKNGPCIGELPKTHLIREQQNVVYKNKEEEQ